MNPDRWQQVKRILDSALDLPPTERNGFIAEAAGSETTLLNEVKSFLAYQSTSADLVRSASLGTTGKTLARSFIDDMPGKKLGHYQILEKLGSGGMGEVYLAKDLALGRQAAIKILAPGVPEGVLSRLAQEAESAVKLQHPGIATFYESGVDNGTEFIAMEYVPGETLRSRLSRGPLGVNSTISIAVGMLEALAHAHTAGILHRDIKPENIMLQSEDLPKLLDFGLAIQLLPADTDETQSMIRGIVAGTLGYMSPEQVRGDADLDVRSDLFSLGAVLYEALSGQPAFPGGTAADRLAAVLYRNPTPLASLGFSSAISNLIQRALEKDRAFRFPSAAAFLKETQALIESPGRIGGSNFLAIMDFKNLSNDSSDDWLGTGIAETLTTDLAQVPGLKILPRERIVQAHRPSKERPDPLVLAQALGCRWMLDGGFQKLGPMVRITARLTEVATLRIAATEKLDGSIEQIFHMQDRLSASVANSLQLQAPVPADTADRPVLTAYEYYNRGRQFFLGYKKGGFEHAASLYEEAIAVDPRYALAYAGLASIRSMKWTFTSDSADLEAAMEHAYRAIELDPSLGEPHVWLGYSLYRSSRLEEGLTEEQKARRLDPANYMAFYFEGLILKDMGKLEEAVRAEQECLRINSQWFAGWMVLGLAYMVLDRSTEAIWCLQNADQMSQSAGTPQLGSSGAFLAEMYRRTGNLEAAKTTCIGFLQQVEASDFMMRDHMRALCLNTMGRCALTERDYGAAAAAFHQTVTQIRGRKQTTAGGFLIVQALAGEGWATKNGQLFDEAVQIFRHRTEWNFSSGQGNMEAEVAVDLGLAAAALGRTSEAREWYEYAGRHVGSQFRLRELEQAISSSI